MKRWLRWLPVGALVLAAPAAAAPKTDVVVMRNGDRVTCEIDQVERGRLRIKTDDMGTLDIEWDKVASVRANAAFEVEDLADVLHYGPLREGPRAGTVVVLARGGADTLDMSRVVRAARLGESLWSRMEGAVDLGFSYTSASRLFSLDFTTDVAYEQPGFELALALSANQTHQPDVPETRRWSTGLHFLRRRPGHLAGWVQTLLESNRELGFSLRSSLAGGAGRYLFQRARDGLLLTTGLSVNREKPTEGNAKTNAEFLLGFQYDRFSYDFPKVDILAKLMGYESLSDWGRTRAEADVRLKREILKDFNLSLRAYESYDSKPATEGAALNDYGVTFGAGWTF